MEAYQKNVSQILSPGVQYIIPLFQRNYLWEKKHWEQLRRDIWGLMEPDPEKGKPDPRKVHFLGPLVYTGTSHLPDAVAGYQLIDGQQRLTTLTLLLAALRDVAKARSIPNLPDEITEDYLLHRRRQGTERMRVLPRLGDREALTAIVEGGRDLTPFETEQIFHAWKYFRRYVEHWARKDTEAQLRTLFSTVCYRLCLVVVMIDGENPYEIFESLNATGLPLAESDLIRNFVFMHIGLQKQKEFQDQHWKALEDMFEAVGELPAVPMTPFYRDYLMRAGRYSKEKATFADFKSSYGEAKFTPDQQVVELKRYATLELMLRRPRLVKNEALKRMLCQVEGMDITTAYAFILNLLDRNQQGKLGDDELCGCLQDLVSFVLRRSLCSESTRPYNRWFVEAIGVLRDNPRQDLEKYWLSRRWPDDAAVQQRIVDFALYRREGAKARVILEAIEEAYGHKEKVDLNDPKIQVEHVLPQTISNNAAGRSWKAMLGENWQEMQEKYVHTLGNLTLTGYNPDLSNSSFDKKKELLQGSHLELNRHFTELEAWNVDTIVARGKKLAEEIIRLWPRPVGAYSASAEAMPEPEEYSTGEKKRLEYWRHFHVRLEERVKPSNVAFGNAPRR